MSSEAVLDAQIAGRLRAPHRATSRWHREWASLRFGVDVAWTVLRAHPLRTTLAVLGVLFGVASLTAVLSLMEGVGRLARRQLAQVGGVSVLSVEPRLFDHRGRRIRSSVLSNLVGRDAEGLANRMPPGTAVTLQLEGAGLVRLGGVRVDSDIRAVTSGVLQTLDRPIEHGRFFITSELLRGERVAVLNAPLARTLAANHPVDALLERRVRIRGETARIIGILRTDPFDRSPAVLLPLRDPRTMAGLVDGDLVPSLTVRAGSIEQLPQVRDVLTEWLSARWPGWSRGAWITDGGAQLRLVEENMRAATLVAASFAALTLLVGAIGVTNVLLVSLAERTRELGIRRACGARTRDIRLQLLVEALAITSFGSVGGVVIGIAIAAGVAAVVVRSTQLPLTAFPGPATLALAVGTTAATGILAGLVPARVAARLSPVDALRQE